MPDPASMTIISDLSALRPEFEPIARLWAHIVGEDLKISFRIAETLRTAERQAVLEKAGASKNKFGWHNVGLAFDFVLFDVAGNYLRDDRLGLYKRCGMIGMALGCRWGGNWDEDTTLLEVGENDLGHLEYHPGFTLQQFLNGRKEGLIA